MSQFDFGTIDPGTKSGTTLASDLNGWRGAVHSSHIGSGRPSYAVAGMLWVNNVSTPWVLYAFDGADDIQIGTINANTNVFTPVLADNSVTLAKMAGGTDGNLITYDTSGNPAYVVTGTAGQLLKSNGAGAVPTFETIGIPAEASAANIRAGAAGTYVSGSAMESASEEVTLTDAATIAVDWSTFLTGVVTLAGNRELGVPTNAEPGTWRTIRVVQDGGVQRTLGFDAVYLTADGEAINLSAGAGAKDTLYIYCESTALFHVTAAYNWS